MDQQTGQIKERWHVGKEIPIAVIFYLVVQTVGFVYGAAVIITEVHDNTKAIIHITETNAERDQRSNKQDVELGQLVQMAKDIKDSVQSIEQRLH